jgi:sec-independent protein translocase protein TatA
VLRGIGTTELIIIAVILLILFGGKKLPELGRGLGDSIKELRKAAKGKEK